ncbi:retrovirus-related pol polyprotein from transposon TNT 1-94 [Tanacetum coccineum]|uniref:Retrovirus-related pol polyprotein from transposon TNT 1-94 n=1 Tax=Tanacetum coccineum TaxID=301880 RepID=A0ABQ5A639_9ASTR
MEEVSLTIDEAKMRKMTDEMLRQKCTSRTTPLVHSCQKDPEAPALSLINQDLLYLKKGNSGPEKIVLSLHKFPAIIFNDDDIEERTSRWVNKCVKKFNPYARYGVEHWKNPHAKIFYIRKQKEPGKSKEEIYSNSKIVQVIKTYWELGHEHKFITKIVARRANDCIVSITEPDYKNLNKNDIEDIYLLIMNGKVPDYADTGLLWSLSVFIRIESMNTPSKEDLDNLFRAMYGEYFEKRSSEVSIITSTQQVHNHEDSPLTSLIIVEEHEAHPIVTTSKEQTSLILMNKADELNQEDSAKFDGNTLLTPYDAPNFTKAESSTITLDPSNMHELDVWELVPRPDGKKIIAVKWLWKNKHNAKNIVIRRKSRLVAKGYKQEEGIEILKESFFAFISLTSHIRKQSRTSSSHYDRLHPVTSFDFIKVHNMQLMLLKKTMVVQIVLWVVDSGCSKHMTGDRLLLRNFIEKFMGTVRFGNDNFALITGYGDYIHGNITICHVYNVEGLGHNLFNVGQFCDEIWKWLFIPIHVTYEICKEMICSQDHLCSACERDSKKASHPPKLVPSDHSKLELLHMDLCGPMRVASINGKKYILVIVDDYSRYTWVYFLRSKDEYSMSHQEIHCSSSIELQSKMCMLNIIVVRNKTRLAAKDISRMKALIIDGHLAPVACLEALLGCLLLYACSYGISLSFLWMSKTALSQWLKKALTVLKQAPRAMSYNMGLWYPKDSGFELIAYLDADHAGCKDDS